MFQGFPEETVRFFLDLRFHNEVTWFHEHREEYEEYIRKPFKELIEDLAPTAREIDEKMEIRPNRCLSRINRDIRFTRDKSPYRDHLWFLFRQSGEERDQSVMYWFEFGPENLEWGLGFWGPNRPAMDALREKILEKPEQIREALHLSGLPNQRFLLSGQSFSRMKIPENCPADLKALYPMKELYIARQGIEYSTAYHPELVQMVLEDMKTLAPMYHLFREAADLGKTRY